MPLPAQSIRAVAERLHWTIHNGQATFAPVPGGWHAVLTPLPRPPVQAAFHVAVVDGTGATRFTSETPGLRDAIRRAERGVLARNALRLVPRI